MFTYSLQRELLSQENIEKLQTELLRKHLAYCKAGSPFYRKVLAGFDETEMSIKDIGRLPFTDKEDILKDHREFICCPEEEISDIVFTSGSTGKPGQFVYTQQDLLRNSYNEERCYRIAGVNAKDRILLTCTMDRCFVAGLAYYTGGVKAGAAVLRNGLASIESHLWIIQEVAPTVLVGIASFLVKLAEYAEKNAVSLDCVQKIICVGEPVKNNDFSFNGIGRRLHDLFPHAQLFATYASTEIATSFAECEAHQGGHIPADLAYVEIVDDAGNVLPPGEIGEVVVTPFGMTGMPLIRFRTGDISFMDFTPCSCGRVTPRIGPVIGRKKHLLKYKGTSIYPQVIFNTVSAVPGVDNYYVVAEGSDLSDEITVYVSVNDKTVTAEMLQAKLLVTCRAKISVKIAGNQEVAEMVFGKSRKPQHFFDMRKNVR